MEKKLITIAQQTTTDDARKNEEEKEKNCDDLQQQSSSRGKKKTSCKKNIAAIALVSLAIAQSHSVFKNCLKRATTGTFAVDRQITAESVRHADSKTRNTASQFSFP